MSHPESDDDDVILIEDEIETIIISSDDDDEAEATGPHLSSEQQLQASRNQYTFNSSATTSYPTPPQTPSRDANDDYDPVPATCYSQSQPATRKPWQNLQPQSQPDYRNNALIPIHDAINLLTEEITQIGLQSNSPPQARTIGSDGRELLDKYYTKQEYSSEGISKTSKISQLLEEAYKYIPTPSTSTNRNSSSKPIKPVEKASSTELSSVLDDGSSSFCDASQKVSVKPPPTTDTKRYKSTLDLPSNNIEQGKHKLVLEELSEYYNSPNSSSLSTDVKPKLFNSSSYYDDSTTLEKPPLNLKPVTSVTESLFPSSRSLCDSSSASSTSTSWVDIYLAIIITLLVFLILKYINSILFIIILFSLLYYLFYSN